jgi:hypothetical protein
MFGRNVESGGGIAFGGLLGRTNRLNPCSCNNSMALNSKAVSKFCRVSDLWLAKPFEESLLVSVLPGLASQSLCRFQIPSGV